MKPMQEWSHPTPQDGHSAVIEDSPPMQRIIQRAFEAEAFVVRLASDGLAGLEAFRAQAPSAVVLDLKSRLG